MQDVRTDHHIVEHRILIYLCSIDNHQKVGWKIAGYKSSFCSYLFLKEVHFLKTQDVPSLLTKDLSNTGNWHWIHGELFSSLISQILWATNYGVVFYMDDVFYMCLCGSRHLLSLSSCHVSCHWLLWKGKSLFYQLTGLTAVGQLRGGYDTVWPSRSRHPLNFLVQVHHI